VGGVAGGSTVAGGVGAGVDWGCGAVRGLGAFEPDGAGLILFTVWLEVATEASSAPELAKCCFTADEPRVALLCCCTERVVRGRTCVRPAVDGGLVNGHAGYWICGTGSDATVVRGCRAARQR